ncbi:CRISPR-associated protein, Cas1 family [Deinococcus reticulitermitis]|uniref:CRISPR-associated endonuclease Cas1 n=1 Tax=Deinococcus reticulitermitis TaxID=856736 RepID=A0A1H7D6T7_9DEIO|nr:CRISPR-associated endonuclease Cas1 [Deinococcus reticulitermitis]SEJ95282.1 CRISPR-associated protein, Cas1 family [Deinococcus reticulitermitis]
MTSVLVQTPGVQISARAGKLVLESREARREWPLGHVTELIVVGHARISTATILDLAGRGVPVHFQARADQLPVSVWDAWNGSLDALRRQFSAPEAHRLAAARALVVAKIGNSEWVLRRLGHPARLSLDAAQQSTDADTLRGHEGFAARQYFAALAELLPGWEFQARLYRPAPDPVNAALSFAYTFLLRHTLSALHHAGLHAGLGTLHVPHGRRPALALDLMEPFRAPVCDLTVLGLLRSGQLPRDGFEVSAEEVRLGQAGCLTVTAALNDRIHRWGIGVALRRQVGAVQAAGQGDACACWQPPVRP